MLVTANQAEVHAFVAPDYTQRVFLQPLDLPMSSTAIALESEGHRCTRDRRMGRRAWKAPVTAEWCPVSRTEVCCFGLLAIHQVTSILPFDYLWPQDSRNRSNAAVEAVSDMHEGSQFKSMRTAPCGSCNTASYHWRPTSELRCQR